GERTGADVDAVLVAFAVVLSLEIEAVKGVADRDVDEELPGEADDRTGPDALLVVEEAIVRIGAAREQVALVGPVEADPEANRARHLVRQAQVHRPDGDVRR